MRRRARVLRALVGNCLALVVGGGVRGWFRNLPLVTPALGSMGVLLAMAAAASVLTLAVASAVATQSEQAYILHVYLADAATPDQVDALKAALARDDRVRGVVLVDREEALQRELRRPGVAGLVDAGGGNPFPASLEVTLRSSRDIGPVASTVGGDPAVDPLYPTSFDPDAYSRLRRMLLVGASVGSALLGVLALVAVAVTANAIRAAVVARRDEVRVMRLVGAPWWAVRMPFLVEGGLTGVVAGMLGGGVVVVTALVAQRASASLFTQLLPGVTNTALALVVVAVTVAGGCLGSAAGAAALRRLPR